MEQVPRSRGASVKLPWQTLQRKQRGEGVKPGAAMERGWTLQGTVGMGGGGGRLQRKLGLDAHCLLPAQTGLRWRSEAEFSLRWLGRAWIGHSGPTLCHGRF